MVNSRALLICGLAMSFALPYKAQIAEARLPLSLAQILSDHILFGKDFPAALAQLQGWTQIGERTVAVFPDQIVGSTPYRTREEAQPNAGLLGRASRELHPRLNPEITSLLAGAIAKQPPAFLAQAILSPEDVTLRIAWADAAFQFLAPDLSVATVRERLGPPEKISEEIVPTESDRRPVVLTVYSYAGGTIAFAESDAAAKPGLVDRVILDVPAVAAALFQEAR